jgi:hypothetical protein
MYTNISDWAKENETDTIKLHLGSGSKYLHGWCNIDAYPSQGTDTHRGSMQTPPDIWANIEALPADVSSVDIIMTQHVVEHFYRHSTIKLFKEFWRVLKPNGVVITEMPDLNRILLLLRLMPMRPQYPSAMKANRDMIKAQLYGASWEANDEGYPYHKYVWERSEFCQMLSEIGFNILLQTGATQSHIPFRDMAVVCVKPSAAASDGKSEINHAEILAPYGTRAFRTKKQLKSLRTLMLALFRHS